MSWEKVITKQGLSVLAGLDGDNVKIVSAWAGTGFYDSENLYENTSLVDPKQSLPIIEDAKIGNKRILRLQVTSAQLEEGYPLNQLGVFISVNDGEPLLYYLAQNEEADNIPSKYAAPGFVSEYIVTIVFTSGVDPDIDVPEIGYITPDALDARINSLKNELAEEYSGGSASIPISATEPTDLQDGQWWFEDLDESEPEPVLTPLEVTTIPFDGTKPFHIESNDETETMTKVTDNEAAATEDDLIIT